MVNKSKIDTFAGIDRLSVSVFNLQILMNVLVIHIHVMLMLLALTALVVSHVTAMWGILEVVLHVKVSKYTCTRCRMHCLVTSFPSLCLYTTPYFSAFWHSHPSILHNLNDTCFTASTMQRISPFYPEFNHYMCTTVEVEGC